MVQVVFAHMADIPAARTSPVGGIRSVDIRGPVERGKSRCARRCGTGIFRATGANFLVSVARLIQSLVE